MVCVVRKKFEHSTAESKPVGSLPLEETLIKSEKLKAHLTEAFPSEGKVAPQVTDEVSQSPKHILPCHPDRSPQI